MGYTIIDVGHFLYHCFYDVISERIQSPKSNTSLYILKFANTILRIENEYQNKLNTNHHWDFVNVLKCDNSINNRFDV